MPSQFFDRRRLGCRFNAGLKVGCNPGRQVGVVPHEQCALVGDLGDRHGPCQFQGLLGLVQHPDLGHPNSGAGRAHRVHHRCKPSSAGKERDGNLLDSEYSQGLRRYLDPAKHRQGFHVRQGKLAYRCAVLASDPHRLATNSSADAFALDHDMNAVVARRPELPGLGAIRAAFYALCHMPLLIDFVGQADRLERALWALGVIEQRRGARSTCSLLGGFEDRKSITSQGVVHGNPQPQFLGRIVQVRFRYGVPGLLQQEHLKAKLHAIGRPRLGPVQQWWFIHHLVARLAVRESIVPGPSLSIFDWDRPCSFHFCQIERGGQSETLAGKRQAPDGARTRHIALVLLKLLHLLALGVGLARLRRYCAGLIDTPMHTEPVHCIGAGQENTFDRHVVEQPWAIGVLSDTSTWPQRGFHNIFTGLFLERIETLDRAFCRWPCMSCHVVSKTIRAEMEPFRQVHSHQRLA